MKENAGINRRIFLLFIVIPMVVIVFVFLPLESEAQKTAKIYGKAAVIMKSGDVKPVAKKNFVLLPFSIWDLYEKAWQEAPEHVGPDPGKVDSEKYLEWLKKAGPYQKKRVAEELQKAKDQGKYIEFRTDFNGSYEVVVPPGSWYICNKTTPSRYIEIGNAIIIWSVPITVKAGQVLKVDLENDNASYILNFPP